MISTIILGVILAQTPPSPENAKEQVYRIPYRLADTKHIIVRVKLNGKGPFSFILDTGSPVFIVSEAVARKSGIDAPPETMATVKAVDIEGGLSLKDVRIRVWDPFQLGHMNATGLADVDIAGVLGYSLIGRYRLDIDLKRRHMLWTDTGVEAKVPTTLEVTGGKPIRPGAEVGELDRIASSAREYLPKKTKQDVRGRGFIGLELEDGEGGVRVKSVIPGSPAARAGIRAGDVILRASLGGPAEPMENADQLVSLASELAGGERLFLALNSGARAWKTAVVGERASL